MNTNNHIIRDWFQGVLMRITLMGRAANNSLEHQKFSGKALDVNNEKHVREHIEYWQCHLNDSQKSLDELKELVDKIFGKSEK